jgi:diguanylate cyclase (GGDEF)-like protein
LTRVGEIPQHTTDPTLLPKEVQSRASLLFQGKVQEVDKRIEAARLAIRRKNASNQPSATSDRLRDYAEDRDERTVALLAAWLDSVVEALNFYKMRLKPYREAVSRELAQIATSASESTRAELERRSHMVGGYSALRALLERSRMRAAQARSDAKRHLKLLEEEEEPADSVRSWRDHNPSEFSEFPELSTKKTFDANLPIAAAESSGATPLSMVFVDVDDLKGLNTKFTNPRVNKGLRELARVLAEVVSGRGKAYRYGGDEFSLLLPNSTLEEAATTADRVCRAVRALSILEEPQMRLTVSCGVACLETVSPRSADELERAAAAAARTAKDQGKDRFVVSPSSRVTSL